MKRNPKYEIIKILNKRPLTFFVHGEIHLKKRRSRIKKTISYNEIGCLYNPSPKFMPVGKLVSLPYVNSVVPLKKQPIRPIIIPIIIGKVNKSPEERFSLIIFFEVSTPINPPKRPPMIDFVFSKRSTLLALNVIKGFSRKPISLEPINAPAIAPRIIESLFLFEIGSNVSLRSLI